MGGVGLGDGEIKDILCGLVSFSSLKCLIHSGKMQVVLRFSKRFGLAEGCLECSVSLFEGCSLISGVKIAFDLDGTDGGKFHRSLQKLFSECFSF